MPYVFHIGQPVRLRAHLREMMGHGIHRVAGFLPPRADGAPLYQIMGMHDGAERIVKQHEIEAV
ncbi:hypothetical protein MAE02_70870 [Microvirga aerophila]|uniref:Uncharacterized protein n=1 Tax=Microvirga aerophila TaxID=670291 RepID=A0A512C5C3_9HYPH|nr:hypothetical protein MAE02_70870 [Microvirga aerophila]